MYVSTTNHFKCLTMHIYIPTLQNLAPEVRGNGMNASWKLVYNVERSSNETGET